MEQKEEKKNESGTLELAAGVGLGAYSLAATAALGATCPLCVIAAPALIGVGVFKKLKNRN